MSTKETTSAWQARFSVFSFSWALVIWLGMLSERMDGTVLRVLVTALAALAVARPGSLPLQIALNVTYIAHYFVDTHRLEFVHMWQEVVVGTAFLLAAAMTYERDRDLWVRRFVGGFAPFAIALGGFAFFAAGFAKLNSSFFDPELSCGPVMFAHQRTVFPFSLLPDAAWLSNLSAPFTAFAEVGSPFLLIHPKTRKFGFVLGNVFLFLAGTNPIARLYVFTGIFLATWLLGFEPSPRFRWLSFSDRLSSITPTMRRYLLWATQGLWLLLALWAVLFAQNNGPSREALFTVGRALYVVWAIGFVAAVGLLGTAAPLRRQFRASQVPYPVLLWAVVAVTVVNEPLVYLGMRAAQPMSMAANLNMGARSSNHYLIRKIPDLGFNTPATLLSSSDKFLDHRGRLVMVDWQLSDYLAEHPETAVSYEVDGVRHDVQRAGDDPSFQRHPLLMLIFDPIQVRLDAGDKRCHHRPPGERKRGRH